MPPGGFGAGGSKEGPPIVPRSFASDVMRVKQTNGGTKAPNSEHKVMDAAQHLVRTFFNVGQFHIFYYFLLTARSLASGILKTRLTTTETSSASNGCDSGTFSLDAITGSYVLGCVLVTG